MRTCCVKNCRINQRINGSFVTPQTKYVSLYKFPSGNPELCAKWVKAVWREGWVPTQYSRICYIHFKPDDFVGTKKIKKIKPNAVPTLHLANRRPVIVHDVSRTLTADGANKDVEWYAFKNPLKNQLNWEHESNELSEPELGKVYYTVDVDDEQNTGIINPDQNMANIIDVDCRPQKIAYREHKIGNRPLSSVVRNSNVKKSELKLVNWQKKRNASRQISHTVNVESFDISMIKQENVLTSDKLQKDQKRSEKKQFFLTANKESLEISMIKQENALSDEEQQLSQKRTRSSQETDEDSFESSQENDLTSEKQLKRSRSSQEFGTANEENVETISQQIEKEQIKPGPSQIISVRLAESKNRSRVTNRNSAQKSNQKSTGASKKRKTNREKAADGRSWFLQVDKDTGVIGLNLKIEKPKQGSICKSIPIDSCFQISEKTTIDNPITEINMRKSCPRIKIQKDLLSGTEKSCTSESSVGDKKAKEGTEISCTAESSVEDTKAKDGGDQDELSENDVPEKSSEEDVRDLLSQNDEDETRESLLKYKKKVKSLYGENDRLREKNKKLKEIIRKLKSDGKSIQPEISVVQLEFNGPSTVIVKK